MKRQSGFTLIELMIASVISLFLMAGIMNLFITTNRTVSLSDALSQNQETGRFAMAYLTRYIRKAGYSESSTLTPPELLIPNSNPDFNFLCSTGTTEAEACSANNPDKSTILGDRLSIVYVTSAINESRSCSGSKVGGALNGEQRLADVFWVSNEAGTIRELRCRTYNIQTENWLDENAISIINNVQAFEFQVGLAASVNSNSTSQYVSVDTMISKSAIKQIRSIRIAVLTTSMDELNNNKIQTKKKTRHYGVLDAPQPTDLDADDTLSFKDGNLRNLFITTIELPGAIEGAVLN